MFLMPERDVSVILMFHLPHVGVREHVRVSVTKWSLNVSRAEEVST